jgi:glutamine synthetase
MSENEYKQLKNVLSESVYDRYMTLEDSKQHTLAEYVWIGNLGPTDLRCKTKTLFGCTEVKSLDDLPVWNYDGSSTNQAPGRDSEVYLNPVAFYPDPFRRGKHVLVMCETCLPDGKLTPIPSNTRRECAEVMTEAKDTIPWFGIEQEYSLMHQDKRTPLGFPFGGYPGPQGPYYCSVGVENAVGRRVAECHIRACLYSGLMISGLNGEVMPGQWEYQVGPCEGISSGDELWMSRYILTRVCEDFGVVVTFHPKPMDGDWNGAGAHVNFSTKPMREEGGYEVIIEAVKKLKDKHDEHIALYGVDNDKRLTGAHETASIDQFSYGVANRGASIRIPRQAKLEGKGYFEDRRPASNVDPYLVTRKLVQTCVLEE